MRPHSLFLCDHTRPHSFMRPSLVSIIVRKLWSSWLAQNSFDISTFFNSFWNRPGCKKKRNNQVCKKFNTRNAHVSEKNKFAQITSTQSDSFATWQVFILSIKKCLIDNSVWTVGVQLFIIYLHFRWLFLYVRDLFFFNMILYDAFTIFKTLIGTS